MDRNDARYVNYVNLLKEELVPAMGCTEPVAIAFAAARARQELGRTPEKVLVEVSGNIVKNVKSVVVPNTGGLKGIKTAVAAGIIAGIPEKMLEVIANVSAEQINLIKNYADSVPIEVKMVDTGRIFEINVTVFEKKENIEGTSSAFVQIIDSHTNIVLIKKNGGVVFEKSTADISADVSSDNSAASGAEAKKTSAACPQDASNCKTAQKGWCPKNQFSQDGEGASLCVESIIEFASTVNLDDVRETIERLINYNSAISAEGLRGGWGANIGKTLMENYGGDVKVRARAAAAAGSDARMSGCELPVVIVCGSGNQGITASMPIIEWARELKSSREELIRALVVSCLIAIHLKSGIGRLSAYCGVVCAGTAAGAGIAYLEGGRMREIAHTIVNSLAIVSGIVCDGAKPSCAGKIASAVDSGILGYLMYKNGGNQFHGGDGIIAKGVENTIRNINRLGHEGMKKTDKEIIAMMLGE